MMHTYDTCIVEHPRLGVLRSFEKDGDVLKARFSWSGARDDPEKAMLFTSVNEALKALKKLPTPARWEAYVLVKDNAEPGYWKLTKAN